MEGATFYLSPVDDIHLSSSWWRGVLVAGAVASVVEVALLVGGVRGSGAGWLLWSFPQRGGRCFCERWCFEGGACVPGEIPCPASVGPTVVASVGVVSFLKASLWLLSPFGWSR